MEAKEPILRGHLRVSQDRSGTGKSPEQQHDEMKAAARRKGWTLHPQPCRDTDRSASRYSKKVREGFTELMADLEDGTFDSDMLGIWESSRGSRRTGEWIDLIEFCAHRGAIVCPACGTRWAGGSTALIEHNIPGS